MRILGGFFGAALRSVLVELKPYIEEVALLLLERVLSGPGSESSATKTVHSTGAGSPLPITGPTESRLETLRENLRTRMDERIVNAELAFIPPDSPAPGSSDQQSSDSLSGGSGSHALPSG